MITDIEKNSSKDDIYDEIESISLSLIPAIGSISSKKPIEFSLMNNLVSLSYRLYGKRRGTV